MNSESGLGLLVSQPQYALIAQALMGDIKRGRYPVGSLLPPELTLSIQFDVSRNTVREAMRILQERGLVTRKRGIGTIVKENQVEPRYVQSTATIADLLQYVEETKLVTKKMSDVVADATLADLLKCPLGQRWLHVRGFRYIGSAQRPIGMTDIYLNAAYAGIINVIGVHKEPVYRMIEKQYGETIIEVRQNIVAIVLNEKEARELSVKQGTAGLVVTRYYIGSNDRILEVAVNLHPAERFSYSQTLRLKNTFQP